VLTADPSQLLAAERLQGLWARLRGYDPPPKPAQSNGLLARLWRRKPVEGANEERPNGLYLVGEVGRGKSMLMDLFFAAAQVTRKRRIHFHQFMQEAHGRVHAWKRANPDGADPIPPLADRIAAEAALLCFDEFQVNDIADAMILERLFRALFEAGTVVVATSNRPPDRLYEHGLQRDRFLPFIELLDERLDRLELDSGRDYRLARLAGKRVYHTPLGPAAERALAVHFADLTDGASAESEVLPVLGRELAVPRCAADVAWFRFEELCSRPLAAADYLAIAEHYAAVLVEGIPRLDPRRRNEARRFHILIDALYEARTLLIASAEVPPDQIYTAGDGAWEFQRTVSRLHEMQSEDYIANRARPPV
jgi:cell division protein ZapE